jgi:dUTP pyrophosphatase
MNDSKSLRNGRRVRIRRLNAGVTLPRYQSPGAAAFDLAARQEVTIQPGEVTLIPTGLVIEVPPGHVLLIVARSSLPLRKQLMVANGVGVIDADYHGPSDEVKVEVYNFSQAPVTIARGERIAQGLIVPVVRAIWDEVDRTDAPSRGGFGSTGGYDEAGGVSK